MSTSFGLILLGSMFIINGLVDATCCPPKQWEGNLSQIEGKNVGTRTTLAEVVARMAFDAVYKLIAFNMSAVSNESKLHVRALLDYHKQVSYIVLNGQCNKGPLPRLFPSLCLPDTAKKVLESYFGAGDDNLNIVTYQVEEKDTTVMTTVTKSCVPVLNVTYGQQGDEKFLQGRAFTGIVLGIKDRSVFDVPPACKKQSFHKEFADIVSQIRTRMKFPAL